MNPTTNPYLTLAHSTLPRLLASFDSDPFSMTSGLGDRRYWAWKTQDFPSAAPQGAVHGLARLVAAGLLPEGISSAAIIRRIDAAIRATGRITARDGSLVEAFPNEKSFCVTALIAFDILVAADTLRPRVGDAMADAWRAVAAPMIDFICGNDETHAVISNHLATAVAALMRWDGTSSSAARKRAEVLLATILENQSDEGWFSEYGGFDPGYETLGLTYLADIHLRHPDLGLAEPLTRSLRFLTHFAHPDGSFGGGYGARNTRFCVPGGIEALTPLMPEACTLAHFLRRSVAGNRVVTLAALDEPNLAPHFNACCWAAESLAANGASEGEAAGLLPCEAPEPDRFVFPKAGLIVDRTPARYAVVSVAKGGYVARFSMSGGPAMINAGVACRIDGTLYSSQAFQDAPHWSLDGNRLVIEAPFIAVISERPTVMQFIALRLMALTIFRLRPLTEFLKRYLVRRLITGQRKAGVSNVREVVLDDAIDVTDTQKPEGSLSLEHVSRPFGVIHMASAGYWQIQDDQE